jgi:aminoglycoside N3'-acetyltransferase
MLQEKIHVTEEELEAALRELGLRAGMYLEVHGSLSSFGHVEGGAVTVIDVLQKIITSAGAIIMPAFPVTKSLELTEMDVERGVRFKIKKLDPNSDERTGMGIIPDTFRKYPGVKTGEGEHRVAAWGTEVDMNAQGFSNLHRHDGYGLLLGVDIYRLTSMHYVESNMPDEIQNIFKPSEEILKLYPEDIWFVETGVPPEKAWYKIQDQAYEKGFIKDSVIGNAKCMFFKVNDVIDLYKKALEEDALGLYGLRKK